MDKCFVVISGLPGSGKSTLGQQLALALDLPFLDKDNILELLLEAKGLGDSKWRRALSRESDLILQTEAARSDGAVLVSHWRLPGMPPNSGTPTRWISALPYKAINVHCECPAELSAARFLRRKRHAGHLDHARSHAEILSSIREAARFGSLDIAPRIRVDTSQSPDLNALVRELSTALAYCKTAMKSEPCSNSS